MSKHIHIDIQMSDCLTAPRGSGCTVSHCLLCKRPVRNQPSEGFWLGDEMHLRFVIVHVECIAQLSDYNDKEQ